jgi:hypothetical protein
VQIKDLLTATNARQYAPAVGDKDAFGRQGVDKIKHVLG